MKITANENNDVDNYTINNIRQLYNYIRQK